jgi:hypothetical protein
VALTYRDRGTTGTQVDVLSGELVVATVYEVKQSSKDNAANWKWTFFITVAPAGFQNRGEAATREIAILSVERIWKDWLKAAALSDWPTV